MTELSLYSFIESIVDVTPPVQGRFAVLEGYGNDLNADNSDDVLVGNVINQATWKKKYPCAVLMPPQEIGRNESKKTVRYLLKMYFLTTTYYNGSGSIKGVNRQTNTSKVSIKEDWSEMRTAAETFRNTMLNTFYSDITVLQYIRPVKSSEDKYERVSLKNNDNLSGVYVTFELDVVMGCEATGDPSTWTPEQSSCCVKPGGTVGQVYKKLSSAYNDAGWADETGGGGVTNYDYNNQFLLMGG